MAASTATLVVRYVSDTSGASKGVDTFGNKVKGFAKTAAKAGATAAVALGAATLWKGFQRLKAIDDAEAKLRGLGHSAKDVKGIMSNAEAAVKGTAFGLGDAATAAAGAVAAGVKPGKELERTLTLVGDAATIAGTDFNEMGSIFNKVAASGKLQGDTIAQLSDRGIPVLKMLSDEMGVTKEQVRQMASAGKIDFKTFQNAMEGGLGGAAQKAGQTFSGAWANVQAALSRVGAAVLSGTFSKLPSVFEQIIGGLDAITPAAAKMGEVLAQVFSAVGSVIGGMAGSGVFTGLIANVKAFATAVADTLGKAFTGTGDMSAFAKQAQQVFTTLVQVVSEAVALITTWLQSDLGQTVVANVIAAFKALVSIVSGALNIIKGVLMVITGILSGDWAKAWEGVKTIVSGVVKIIGALIGLLWTQIKNGFSAGLNFIKSIWSRGWQAVVGIVTGLVGRIVGVVKAIPAKIRSGLSVLGAILRTLFTKAWDGARNATVRLVTRIIATVKSLPGKIKSGLSRLGGFVKTVFTKAWDAARNATTRAITRVLTLVRNLPGKVRSGLSNLGSILRTIFTNAWNAAKTAVTNAIGKIVSTVKGLPGKIRGIGSALRSAGSAIITAFVNGMKSVGGIAGDIASSIWNVLKGLINSAITSLNNALEFRINLPGPKDINVNPPNIPKLAEGGVVRSPTLAVVGDNPGSAGEAVIPLDKYDLGSGPITVEVHLDGQVIGNYVQKRVDNSMAKQARRIVMGVA